jgi:hypothetical protein
MATGINPFKTTSPISVGGNFQIIGVTGKPVDVPKGMSNKELNDIISGKGTFADYYAKHPEEKLEPGYTGSASDYAKTNILDPLLATPGQILETPFVWLAPFTQKYGIYMLLFAIMVVAILGLILPEH